MTLMRSVRQKEKKIKDKKYKKTAIVFLSGRRFIMTTMAVVVVVVVILLPTAADKSIHSDDLLYT